MSKTRLIALFVLTTFLAGLALGALVFHPTIVATAQTEEPERLFVNLTDDDINTSAMAINFATRVLNERGIAVTIFLNVEAVRLVDTNIPESTHPNGMTPRQMLTAFMEAGGEVIVCPMCMANVGGMTEADLLEGVQVGSSDLTWGRLFGDDGENVTVISY